MNIVAAIRTEANLLASWVQLDAEAAEERAKRQVIGAGYDYRPIVALCVGAFCLALMEYAGHQYPPRNAIYDFQRFLDFVDPYSVEPRVGLFDGFRHSPWVDLAGHAWWALWRVFGYFVIPACLIKFVWRERIRDYGLDFSYTSSEHAPIYIFSYLVVLSLVIVLGSQDPHFQTYYPFYDRANRSWLDFFAWELLYGAQFFSLEFFFRGFWIRSMRTAMGSHAIFVMTVPYCMIHFGKPFLETLGAIIAGIWLGTLAMKTRSIWGGFFVHIGVAISMDAAALGFTERGLPQSLLPPNL